MCVQFDFLCPPECFFARGFFFALILKKKKSWKSAPSLFHSVRLNHVLLPERAFQRASY